jgi:hypothetical protein
MPRHLILVALLLACAASAAGQTSSASVVGRVTVPTGAVIPGVLVKITNLDTNVSRQVISNAVGDFTIPYLNPGRYWLEATITGFFNLSLPILTEKFTLIFSPD